MKLKELAWATAVAMFAVSSGVAADSFSISPTNLTVKGSERATALTVKSGGPGRIQGQVRVMRWTRSGGKDVLTPTRDVVASPPVLQLERNKETTIRLVRVKKSPPKGPRECYRVLIDQLPGSRRSGSAINFTIRHSVPLCFLPN